MSMLLKLGLVAGLGGLFYNYMRKRQVETCEFVPVYSSGVVRNAGPDEQKFMDNDKWDKIDEAVDESFPASDPPSTY
jgi:hypothetical protein